MADGSIFVGNSWGHPVNAVAGFVYLTGERAKAAMRYGWKVKYVGPDDRFLVQRDAPPPTIDGPGWSDGRLRILPDDHQPRHWRPISWGGV